MNARLTLLVVLSLLAAACGSTVRTTGSAALDATQLAAPSTTGTVTAGEAQGTSSMVAPSTPSSGTASSGGAGSTASSPTSGIASTNPSNPGGSSGATPGEATTPTAGSSSEDAGSSTNPPAAGNDDLSGFGFTADTIRVGVATVSADSSEQLANAGYGEAALGDTIGFFESLVAGVNARGGVAGRQLEVVTATMDTFTATPEQDLQAICTRFSQDDPVFAVLTILATESFAGCLSDNGIPVIGASFGDAQSFALAPLTVIPTSAALDTQAGAMAATLAAQGFFTSDDPLAPVTIGVVREDAPKYERAMAALAGGLGQAGFSVTTEVVVANTQDGRYGDQTAQISSAVLRMRSEGVTHVLFVSFNAFTPVMFLNAAAAQGYRPLYGFNSSQLPQQITELVADPSQFIGARTIGHQPISDVSFAADPVKAPRSAECEDYLRGEGYQVSSAAEKLAAQIACDIVWYFEAAGNAMGPPDAQALISAAYSLREFPSALNLSVNLRAPNPFGAGSYLTGGYDEVCGCFLYDPGATPRPF